jgi:hypothetical protein
MKISDMRPKEDFRIGDLVGVVVTSITGKIEKFDCDHRLAWLGNGWWYLKDLEKVRAISRKDREVHAKGAKEMQFRFTCDPDNFYSKMGSYPCVIVEMSDCDA